LAKVYTALRMLGVHTVRQLADRSNREFVYVLELFSMVSGIDISHKAVERLYSDELLIMTF